MAFPKREADIAAILYIWKERISNYEAQYNLTEDMIKQIESDEIVFSHLLLCVSLLTQDTAEFYAYKENSTNGDPKGTSATFPTVNVPALPTLPVPAKPGIVKRNTDIYNYLKNHPNRSNESLADLGITTTPPTPISPENLKPTISGRAITNDRIELTFDKQRQSAVRFQMRRGNESWVNVGDPTSSPYIDATPSVDGNPEKREYRSIYLIKNDTVGQYSDIITVYTTP